MTFKRIGIVAALVMLMAVAFGGMIPATVQAQSQNLTEQQKQTMWCNIENGDFYKLCQDQEFIKGLSPEQLKQLDAEWQRRVPNMTPAERELYYPQGRRYYTGS